MYHPIRVSPKGFPVEHIMIIMDWRLWSSQISSFPPSGAQQEPICSAKLSHWDDWRTTASREHQPWNPGPENMTCNGKEVSLGTIWPQTTGSLRSRSW